MACASTTIRIPRALGYRNKESARHVHHQGYVGCSELRRASKGKGVRRRAHRLAVDSFVTMAQIRGSINQAVALACWLSPPIFAFAFLRIGPSDPLCDPSAGTRPPLLNPGVRVGCQAGRWPGLRSWFGQFEGLDIEESQIARHPVGGLGGRGNINGGLRLR